MFVLERDEMIHQSLVCHGMMVCIGVRRGRASFLACLLCLRGPVVHRPYTLPISFPV